MSFGINVTDHGAVLDGVTDDTTAFVAAIQAANAADKPLVIPEGHLLASSFNTANLGNISADVAVYGAGSQFSKLTLPESLNIHGTSSITFKGIHLCGLLPQYIPNLSGAFCAIINNITLSGIPSTVDADGQTVKDTYKVVVLGQTDATENGTWIVNAAGAWTRADTADLDGGLISVAFGSTYARKILSQDTASPVIGTDNIVWTERATLNYILHIPLSITHGLTSQDFRTILFDDVKFSDCRRGFSAYDNDLASSLVYFTGSMQNCIFENFGDYGAMLRYELRDYTICNNAFRNPMNRYLFDGALSGGDKGALISSGIQVYSNHLRNLESNEMWDVDNPTYTFLIYGKGNKIFANQFVECSKGVYSRGANGEISFNSFVNDTIIGRFPIIFKGGGEGVYKALGNTFSGKYTSLLLHDEEAQADLQFSRNSGNIAIVARPIVSGGSTTDTVMSLVKSTSGSWYIDSNNFVFDFEVATPFIGFSRAGTTLSITRNHFDVVDHANFVIMATCNNSDLKNLAIKDNPFLCFPAACFTQAIKKEITGNTWVMRTQSYANWFRVNGGADEFWNNNIMIAHPNVTPVSNSFRRPISYDGLPTGKVIHRNWKVQGTDVANEFFYHDDSSGNLNIDIDNFETGNHGLIAKSNQAGLLTLEVSNIKFVNTAGYILHTLDQNSNTINVSLMDCDDVGSIVLSNNSSVESVSLNNVRKHSYGADAKIINKDVITDTISAASTNIESKDHSKLLNVDTSSNPVVLNFVDDLAEGIKVEILLMDATNSLSFAAGGVATLVGDTGPLSTLYDRVMVQSLGGNTYLIKAI